MANTTTTDRRASAEQVRASAQDIKRAAAEVGVSDVRLHDDGTLVVHSEDPGLREVLALVKRARQLVGVYVHVITDEVPAAKGAQPL